MKYLKLSILFIFLFFLSSQISASAMQSYNEVSVLLPNNIEINEDILSSVCNSGDCLGLETNIIKINLADSPFLINLVKSENNKFNSIKFTLLSSDTEGNHLLGFDAYNYDEYTLFLKNFDWSNNVSNSLELLVKSSIIDGFYKEDIGDIRDLDIHGGYSVYFKPSNCIISNDPVENNNNSGWSIAYSNCKVNYIAGCVNLQCYRSGGSAFAIAMDNSILPSPISLNLNSDIPNNRPFYKEQSLLAYLYLIIFVVIIYFLYKFIRRKYLRKKKF